MTTFSHTITLDDGERSTLSTALAMLKDDCLDRLETTPGAPYKARLRNIESIEKKLDADARQTNGNTFDANLGPKQSVLKADAQNFYRLGARSKRSQRCVE